MKKHTPAGLTLSIQIAASAVKDYWVAYTVHRQSESGYSKMRKISVSAMDGILVGRQERIHSGVLVGEYVDSCAPPQKSYLQS